MKDLASIRKEYTKARLDQSIVQANPFAQFDVWLEEAVTAKVPEPTAMNLATVNEHGRPTSRIVLLKGVENEKFYLKNAGFFNDSTLIHTTFSKKTTGKPPVINFSKLQ